MSGEPLPEVRIEAVSAITLATRDMRRAVAFYETLGFAIACGGGDADFTSMHAGANALNLIAAPEDAQWGWWGRVIILVSDVDAMYARVTATGFEALFPPRDGEWGERYFHLTGPDGHELSFVRPLPEKLRRKAESETQS